MTPACDHTVARARIGNVKGIARVHIEAWRSTYAGLLPDCYLAKLSDKALMGQWVYSLTGQGSFAVFVIKGGRGNIVAYGSCDRARRNRFDFEGEVQTLYVRDDHRSIGIGRALMAEMARHLTRKGCLSTVVWVLRDNPSRWFYAALGGTPVAEELIAFVGTRVLQVAYHWPDIGVLLERSPS
jgi:GNAT superfamily N-acetyltransferase